MKHNRQALGSVADLQLGKMLDEKKNKGIPRPYLANVNVRWGSFDLENLREMRFEDDELEQFGLRDGDIVMCEGGEPGRCAIWKGEAEGMMFQKALHRIRAGESLDQCFLFYRLFFMGRSGEFASLFTGSTIKHLPRQNLAKVEIEFPELPKQRRCASILTAYDDLIENNRRRMALLEEAARKLYREWFIRLRFPGHQHTPVHNCLPEGWERKTLGDVAEINRANLPKGFDAEIEYIDISAVTPGRINETTRYQFSDAPSRARRVVQHGDILWSCVRPNRKSYAVVWNPGENLIASTGFAVITPDGVPTSFLEQATTTDDFVRYLENNAKGAAYPAVLASDFERAELLIPPKHLLDSFATFAEPLLAQRHNLETQSRKLRAARDRLLPKLMSGEIEV